jgi:hypothetical protein
VIDWPQILFNALWIVGSAVILSAFSHIYWLAHIRDGGVRRLLDEPIYQLPFSLGLCLISLGLLLLSNGWLERIVWTALTLVTIWKSFGLWRLVRDQPPK